MKALAPVALFAVALLIFIPAQAYLEWQPPQLTNGQNSLKIRFWAKPEQPAPPLTGIIQIQLTSLPYQRFVVCADNIVIGTHAFIAPFEEDWKQGYSYELITTEPDTQLKLLSPKACTVDDDIYPYHFLDLLHSEKPFLVVEGKSKDHKQQETNDDGLIPLQPYASETITTYGYGTDDKDQHKRPPRLPFQSSGDYSLMVLPSLKLPEELKAYLPGIRLYYNLLEQLGYGEDINIVLQVAGHEPVSIPVHPSERAELAKNLTSAQALLRWLAPKLNVTEELVGWLLDIQAHFGATTLLDTSFAKAIEKQLAMILEQNNSEFNVQLEISELKHSIQSSGHLFFHTSSPATDTVNGCPEADRWIRSCPKGKQQQQQQERGALGQNSQSTGSHSQSSTAAGSGYSGASTQHEQTGRKNKQEEGAGNATAIPVPEVTITFVGNSNTGKSTLANLLLGFRHFREGGVQGVEQDYLHDGVRIRALPGYSQGLPPRYSQQYDVGRDDIIMFVLDNDLSADDIRLLKDILSKRDQKQDRLIIVRNKCNALRAPATLEAVSSNISLHESLLLAKDRMQRDIRERLREAGLSDRIPILFASANEDSWVDVKELHDSINMIIGNQNESWNRFSIAFDTIDRIYNEITERHKKTSGSLAENTSSAFRRFMFSRASQYKAASLLRNWLRKKEWEKWEPEFKFLDMDSVITGIITMITLPPEVNENLIARIEDTLTTTELNMPRYGSIPENAEELLSLGAKLSVWMGRDNTLFIARKRTIIARILARQNHHSAYQSGILGESSSIFFSDHTRRCFLWEKSHPKLFLRKISDLVAGKMAYLKFTEIRKELSRNHSCPGEKCPPPLRDFPPAPPPESWFWQGCGIL